MNSIYTSKNISFDDILDYVFEEASAEKEAALEYFFDEEVEYADVVNDILIVCAEEGFKNRLELEKYLQQEHVYFIEKFKGKKNSDFEPVPKKRYKTWHLFALLIGLVTIIGLSITFFGKEKTSFHKENAQAMISKEWELEEKGLSQANSGKSWQNLLASGYNNSDFNSYKEALKVLKSEMQATKELSPKQYYFRGVLQLYVPYNKEEEMKEATPFLEEGKRYRSQRANFHIVISEILLNQRKDLEDVPFNKADFPDFIQLLLEANGNISE